ncbi:MAG: phosphatidate cytidylyltransferase [Candidatus Moranbacteria bacterium]|nr:phosphatidate cytidylyltransferase [Candidatus Moranbacteria bacterium]
MLQRLWIFLWLPVLAAFYFNGMLNSVLAIMLGIVICLGTFEVCARRPFSGWSFVSIFHLLGVSVLFFLPAQEIIFIVLVVFANDTFAFIGGKYLGFHFILKTKIFPKTSSNKTLGGLIYGLAGGCLSGWIFIENSTFPNNYVLLSPLVCLLAIAGDFLESKFKRHHNIKDSGEELFTGLLMYGHGGIYDRFDALAMASLGMGIFKLFFH